MRKPGPAQKEAPRLKSIGLVLFPIVSTWVPKNQSTRNQHLAKPLAGVSPRRPLARVRMPHIGCFSVSAPKTPPFSGLVREETAAFLLRVPHGGTLFDPHGATSAGRNSQPTATIYRLLATMTGLPTNENIGPNTNWIRL